MMDPYKKVMYESLFSELAELSKVAFQGEMGTDPTMVPTATGAPQAPAQSIAQNTPAKPGTLSKMKGNISGVWNQTMAPTNFADHAVAGARQITQKGGLKQGLGAVKNVAKHQGLKTALTRTNLGALGTAGAVGALGLGALGLGANAISNMRNGGQ